MKKLAIIIFLVAFAYGCKRTDVNPYQSRGIITGYDFGQCPTCGGLKITIQNDTTRNAPSFYQVDTTLSQLGFSEKTSLPINVQLNWHRQPGSNPGNYIIVSKIIQAK